MLRMHLDGLKRMLDIRGGLDAIRDTNPMIANSVFWYDNPCVTFNALTPFRRMFAMAMWSGGRQGVGEERPCPSVAVDSKAAFRCRWLAGLA